MDMRKPAAVSAESAFQCAALAVGSARATRRNPTAFAARSLVDFDGGAQKTYQRMIEAMDLQIGRVLEALDANGLAENTIVIFTSDNGGERFAGYLAFHRPKDRTAGRRTCGSGHRLLAGAHSARPDHRSGGDHDGLAADAAGGRGRLARSRLSAGRHQLVADAHRAERDPSRASCSGATRRMRSMRCATATRSI